MKDDSLKTVKATKWLASLFGRNEQIPDGLEGATIVHIGCPRDENLVEGGGLIIDYLPQGSKDLRRVVLAFNDTAMWAAAYYPNVLEPEGQAVLNPAGI